MEKEDYFSDDCIVEDEIFRGLKKLLICPICKKIYKDPMLCTGCQGVYCQKCIGNKCPKNCINNKLMKSVSKNEMISKIKYKCKNCLEEVYQSDIKAHLESNCQHKEEIQTNRTLSEIYGTKKQLKRLSPKEMEQYNKEEINHFTSK
jgi:hypothetical protein